MRLRSADRSINVIGLPCPVPVMRILESLADLGPGQVLEVVSDDRSLEDDAMSICRKVGSELLEFTVSGGIFRVWLKKA
jgi:tRNA 2-thiouridine synthesizing protein A